MQPLYTEQLYLSKKERRGILMLMILLALFIVLPFLWKSKSNSEIIITKPPEQKVIENSEHNKLYQAKAKPFRLQKLNQKNNSVQTDIQFNPNTVDFKTAIKAGMPKKIFNILQKFRQKGFKFKSVEDLKKIYGVDEKLYAKLSQRIILPIQKMDSIQAHPKLSRPLKIHTLEVNTADIEQWISLPGIGPKLAERIIKFRDGLGGFYQVDQIKETYGLQDSVFQYIKSFLTCNGQVNKIRINQMDIDELNAHPYINYKQAQFIVNYRRQHGGFNDTDEMLSTSFFDLAWIEKIGTYLQFD